MTGAASWLSVPAVPVPVAVSVWLGGAAAVGVALLLLGADGGVRAEAPSSSTSAPPRALAPISRLARLPDGRDEAGTMAISSGHVRASLPFQNEASLSGYGTVRLDAEPTEDEITVRMIVDAPTERRRWSSLCEVVLRVDGDEVRVRAQPAGTRMKSGAFYDALRFELGIDTVRRLSRATRIEGEVCGDPLELPDVQRATLRSFVEGFDDLALPVLPSRETELELAPVDPDEFVEDPDLFLEPV